MRNPQVLVQIESVDKLLATTGVREYCLECIHDPKRGGCCNHCSFLGPNGCTNKPLSCALWLCSDAAKKFPKVEVQLVQIKDQWPHQVARGHRQFSIQAEEQM